MRQAADLPNSLAVGSFVPLEPRSGAYIGDCVKSHRNENIVVWGAGVLGRCLMRLVKQFVLPSRNLYFADSNPELSGSVVDGCSVLDFDGAIAHVRDGAGYLLIAVAGHTKAVAARLTEAGLQPSVDFDSYLTISRPEAVVQVSERDGENISNMPLGTCQAILAKLKADVPDLFHIDLSGWGDPLDNPQLPEIIRSTHSQAPCTVTTRLLADRPAIEQALYAEPTQFVVSVDGFNDSYKKNTSADCWEIFLDRLHHLSVLQSRLVGRTEIRLRYNILKNNGGADYLAMQSLCRDLGIKMVKAIGYIDPYDLTLQLCQTGTIADDRASSTYNLAWSLREALELAHADQQRPCLCQRIFPVIHTDGAVGICHLYKQPVLHHNYLIVDYADLQNLRLAAAHCRTCQRYALHRLDIDVLQSRHARQLLRPPEPMHA